MGSRTKNTARNIASGLLYRAVSILLPFLNRTAILRLLGAEYTGLSNLFASILSVLSISELGFATAVVYSLYGPIARGDRDSVCEIVSMLRRIYQMVGAFILCAGLALMPFLDRLIKGGYPEGADLRLLFFLYLVNSAASYWLFAYKECVLIADQRQDVANNIRSLVSVVSYLAQLATLLVTKDFYLYLVVSVAGTVVSSLLIGREVSRRYPWLTVVPDRVAIPPDVRKRVGGLLVNRLCDTFRNSLDSVVISSSIGLVATAIYGNYFYVYSALYGIMSVICSSMGASVGNSIIVKSRRENYENMLVFSLIFSFVMGWSAAVMACLYQPFMALWTGADMLLSDGDMLLFVLYYYLINMNNIRNQYVSGTGMWWELRATYVAEAVANVALNVALGRLLGITGILLATVITVFFFNYLQRNSVLFRTYFAGESLWVFYRQQLHYLLAFMLATGASYLVCNAFFSVESVVGLLVRGIIAAAVSGMALLLLYRPAERWGDGVIFMRRILFGVRGHREE